MQRERRDRGTIKDLMAYKKEERGKKGVHRFWRRGTACFFDMLVTDSDTARHRGPPIAKVLERGGKEKKRSTRRNAIL